MSIREEFERATVKLYPDCRTPLKYRWGIRLYPWYMRAFWSVANRLRGLGYRFHADGSIELKPGTCPYALHPDISVRRCVRERNCGCGEMPLP